MILVLSGEGPTDLGTMKSSESGRKFVPGPMAWIVDRLIGRQERLDYSILEIHANGGDCICFLSETELSALRPAKPMFFPRGTNADGNQYFRKGAYLLGKYAKGISSDRNAPVIAVFFRDADGTRSTPRTEWEGKVTSMQRGFEASEFASGVPMVPRPKSEAWMLCGLMKQEDAGRDCSCLEDEPGNDASPKSLKGQLSKRLTYDPTAEYQADLVRTGQVDPQVIDLPSFLAFRVELDRAFANASTPVQ